jgi:hypothetical protein
MLVTKQFSCEFITSDSEIVVPDVDLRETGIRGETVDYAVALRFGDAIPLGQCREIYIKGKPFDLRPCVLQVLLRGLCELPVIP